MWSIGKRARVDQVPAHEREGVGAGAGVRNEELQELVFGVVQQSLLNSLGASGSWTLKRREAHDNDHVFSTTFADHIAWQVATQIAPTTEVGTSAHALRPVPVPVLAEPVLAESVLARPASGFPMPVRVTYVRPAGWSSFTTTAGKSLISSVDFALAEAAELRRPA